MIPWFIENIDISPKEREESLIFALSSNWKTKTQSSLMAEGFSSMVMVVGLGKWEHALASHPHSLLSSLRHRKITSWKWRGQGKTETGVQVAHFGFNGIFTMAKVGSLCKVKSLFYFHVFGILLKQPRKLETFSCLGWIFVIYLCTSSYAL